MNMRIGILVGCGFLGAGMLAGCFALAQRPGGGSAGGQAGDNTVTRMMEFDANKDGKLTRAEVTDERLTRLFDHADADKDGTVTRAELTALVAAEPARRGGPGGFGPGGFGPPPGGGPPGSGFRLGDVVPQMFQSRLNLSAEQKTQIEALQKEVDARLDRINAVSHAPGVDSLELLGGHFFVVPSRGLVVASVVADLEAVTVELGDVVPGHVVALVCRHVEPLGDEEGRSEAVLLK